MKNTIISLLILLFINTFSFALEAKVNSEILLNKGNGFYQKQNYSDAIKSYSEIINNGYESAQLYFNLGNSYFKTNDYTNAIYFFEKAKKLAPSDEDIQFNLALSNSKIIDKIDQIPIIFYKKWWNAIVNLFNETTWSILLISLISVFLTLITFFYFSKNTRTKKISFYSGLSILILIIFISFFATSQFKQLTNKSEAIIFSYTVNVKASPDKNSKDIFVIHEGTKILLFDSIGDWHEVKIPNGSKGWVNKNDFKII